MRPIYEACTDDVEAAYSKFECLGYPRGQRKTSMFSFYATIPIGQFPPRGVPHTLPIRVCAAQRGRDFEAPDLERGIHFRGVF